MKMSGENERMSFLGSILFRPTPPPPPDVKTRNDFHNFCGTNGVATRLHKMRIQKHEYVTQNVNELFLSLKSLGP